MVWEQGELGKEGKLGRAEVGRRNEKRKEEEILAFHLGGISEFRKTMAASNFPHQPAPPESIP